MTGEQALVILALILSRFYLVYWMFQGLSEIAKVGNKRWTWIYLLALIVYIYFASASSLDHDLHSPLRLIGSIAGGTIVTILVTVLRKRAG